MDKYTKVKTIGKGNMGTCTLARNNEDGKYYVIKQVDLTRMSKKDRQQSLNEARVLSSLRHPNIINYVDSFLARKSDNLCIVMEYAESGDVSSRLKKNYGVNVPEKQVLDWLIQLVLSLNYVHERKILHRDVKTQNIFLTNENLIKLGDFGIARTLANTYDQAKTFVGTPYYLSPELILERPYDHRSDVWALGVVLYELLTLTHPFNAKDMKGLLQRILAVQYDPIPALYSAGMRDIVARMLVREPAQRIELSDILQLPLVRDRLQQWLREPDAMPHHYVRSLCKHRLLPLFVDGAVGVPSPRSAARAAAAVAHEEFHNSSDATAGHTDPHVCARDGGVSSGCYAAPSTAAAAAAARAAGAVHVSSADTRPPDQGRPAVPPLKPYTNLPQLTVASPQQYASQLPPMHPRVQSHGQAAGPSPTFSSPFSTPSTARSAALPPYRQQGDPGRRSSPAPLPVQPRATVRAKVTARSYARPYVAQSHQSPSPYLGDGVGGSPSPPGYLLLANPRKSQAEQRRPQQQQQQQQQQQHSSRPSGPYLNPLYRVPRQSQVGYRQLAPPPPATSDIKAMLHRAAAERARRRQEFA
ncbi:protein kinase [Novymonas esmeraldas]|uniref:non-specific serine/threonine protein kinase n=1 Tax=Novymonas esmeraldas TaxID=1808958 RepID=A0AAW0EW39_9TRYP